jgi:SAM-dependent methyltransferase
MSGEAERVVDLYERKARAWVADRTRQRTLMEKGWLERFTALVPAGGTILDIGCGSGRPIAAYMIDRGYDVTGIDSSPTMIELARGNFPGQDWLVADMRYLALRRRFLGLIAWDSFFHLTFDDQRRMFPIFAAHAAPSAPLWFSSGPRHGEAIGNLHGEPLYHASLDPAEYRSLLAANGFSVVDHVAEDPTCGGHTVWLARRNKDG